ncbi:hypothetical protein BC826DRAFT_1132822, partial [Russula brevipes]
GRRRRLRPAPHAAPQLGHLCRALPPASEGSVPGCQGVLWTPPISAFMLASKIICDDTYSNKSWCIVGQGMFALQEINQMEQEMCSYLEWQLNVDPSTLRDFQSRVQQDFTSWTLSSDGAPPTGTGTIHAPECESHQLQHWFFHTGFRSPCIPTARWTCHSESFDPRIPILAPDTPEASHSVSTSPTSSVSPQTPPDVHGSGFGPNVVSAKLSPL